MARLSFKFYQILTFFVLFIGYAIYSYNRKSVTYILPELVKEGLTKEDAGKILSTQNTAYMIGKIIAGILSDKLNSKLLFSTGLLLSGFFTILFSQTSNFYLFIVCWFFNGLFQGAGWPALAKLIQRWFSKDNFGIMWSILSASANLSLSISPYFATYFILNYGWKFSLIISGLVCILYFFVSVLTLTTYPESVGFVSFIKDEKLNTKKNKILETEAKKRNLITNPFLWLISFSYMIVFLTKSCLADWALFYLKDDLQFSHMKATSFISILELSGFIGSIIIGYLSDRIAKKPSELINPYHNPKLSLTAFCIICYSTFLFLITQKSLFNQETSYLLFILITSLLGAFLLGSIQLFGVIATESAPPSLSGTTHAVAAAFANLGAIISGYPVLKLAGLISMKMIFVLMSSVSFFCVFIMFCSRMMSIKKSKLS